MKYFFSIVFLIFFLSENNAQQADKVFWKENDSLTWNDFKADAGSERYGGAMSFCGFQYISCKKERKKDKQKYQVSAYFKRSASWVRVKEDYILRHERLHFDIAELFARKLRKAFSEIDVAPENSKAEIYDDIFKEYAEIQSLYDKETIHGTEEEINDQWVSKIKAQLKELENYKTDECY